MWYPPASSFGEEPAGRDGEHFARLVCGYQLESGALGYESRQLGGECSDLVVSQPLAPGEARPYRQTVTASIVALRQSGRPSGA
jgi:hypothetical protein